MPPRNRPSAFEVSFGEPGPSTQASLQRTAVGNSSPFARAEQRRNPPSSSPAPHFEQGSSQRTLVGTAPGNGRNAEKRKTAQRDWGTGVERPEKRGRSSLPPKQYYDPDEDYFMNETADMLIFGEDPDEEGGENSKPTRVLTDFIIFDIKHGNEIVPLDALDDRTIERQLEAVGNVAPMFINEEDAGQDDDVSDDVEKQRMRTTVIWDFQIYYMSEESVYIQTQFANYALKRPRASYRAAWMSFYRPHRATQLIMTFANQDTQSCSHNSVVERFEGSLVEELDKPLTQQDINEAEAMMLAILDDNRDESDYASLRSSAYVQQLRFQFSKQTGTNAPRPPVAARQHVRKRTYGTKNIDLLVLQPEYQTSTTVTPLIYKLAEGLFSEQLKLLASSRPRSNNARQEETRRRKRLLDLLRRTKYATSEPFYPRDHQLHGQYWSVMVRDGVEYKIGDLVLLPAGEYPGRKREPIPSEINDETVPVGRTIADYFWFGRIVFFDQRANTVHLRWFEHSSKTLMQEIHDPYELFYTDICNTEPVGLIVGKIALTHHSRSLLQRNASRFAPGGRMQFDDMGYFFSFKYNQVDGSFQVVTEEDEDLLPGPPPDSCTICSKKAAHDEENYPESIANGKGVAFRGVNYHVNDFVMLRGRAKDDLTCIVAQIAGFHFDNSARHQGLCMLSVVPLGRINDILTRYAGDEVMIKDERHFFLTSDREMFQVTTSDLIRKCRVVNYFSMSISSLEAYLDESPYHFYVQYVFPRLKVTTWNSGEKLRDGSVQPEICHICWREYTKMSKDLRDFKEQQQPLRAFDPFGGVGAFALSMQEAGCVKLTHAVEISPSAALTIKKNSPQTKVYNQCSNNVLQDAVKRVSIPGYASRPEYTALSPKHPSVGALPDPPKPGDIDCIIAGFPCQPHSTLNMFQKASDRKSHLMLNLLSWVDFLEPKFCYFENVRGFLQYNLKAVQASRYRVKDGIPVGGLKFLNRALVTMGYQVRFGTLQAAHYGVPQSRIRFFLIAARMDQLLPRFPLPLYTFPVKDSLEAKFPHGLTIKPISTEQGVAPFKYITVDDAIGDLYRFDWQNPHTRSAQPRTDPITHRDIRIVACDATKKICFPFKSTTIRYHTTPRTRFQKKARAREDKVKDLQHITRVLKENTIKRVCHVPLQPKADYHAIFADRKNLPDDLFEWVWSDPKSAVARRGFRKGLYGRLDANGWFNTTVTNVEPTAKQSWVLNPYCKRVVTVRELARSQGFPDDFQFHCIDTPNVKTMQREIGNAVPWQVGYALGRGLRDTLFEEWLEKKRESSQGTEGDS